MSKSQLPSREALIQQVMACVPPGKVSLDWGYVPADLRRMLRMRFSNLDEAKKVIDLPIRDRRYQEKWSADWPELVDPKPFSEKHGERLLPEDKVLVKRRCEHVRRTKTIPSTNNEQRQRIERYCRLRAAYKLLGIPYFKRDSDRQRMLQYWSKAPGAV